MTCLRWLACALAALVLPPTSAQAGTYDVWSCADPTRLVYAGTGGLAWPAGWRPAAAPGTFAAANCTHGNPSTSKGIEVTTIGGIEARQEGNFEFTAPPGTAIELIRLWRDVKLATPGVYGGFDFGTRYECSAPCVLGLGDRGVAAGDPFAAQRFVQYQPVYSEGPFRLYLQCARQDGCASASGTDYVVVYASLFTLADTRPPVLSERPTGSLLTTLQPLAGSHTFHVAASDEGAGIAAFALEVDGTETRRWQVSTMSKPCAAPFNTPQPCPAAATGTYGFDTTALADGRHSLRVVAIDASGNATAGDPVEVVTENGVVGCRRGGPIIDAGFGPRRRRAVTIRYGSAAAALRGRVVSAGGEPLAGARLQVIERHLRAGAEPGVTGTVDADARGRFRLRLAHGPSREVRIGLARGPGMGGLNCSRRVRLNVRAGVAFSVRPHRVRANGGIAFRGRLRGGPGRRGVQVAIYAVSRRGRDRVPVEVVRTDERGRFRFRYRFRRSFAPFTYRFRARLRRLPSYPYAAAWSKTVVVQVVR